jgi:hypothetical protein
MLLLCIGGDDAAEEAQSDGINDLFRARLDQIINMKHELVLLAGKIDWDWIDGSRRSTARTAGRASRPASYLHNQNFRHPRLER